MKLFHCGCVIMLLYVLCVGLYVGESDITKLSNSKIGGSYFNLNDQNQACIIDVSTLPDANDKVVHVV